MDRSSVSFPCPCCGHIVFDEPPGSFAICAICFWEDDWVQLGDPTYSGGANNPSLEEAQANYERFGACEEQLVEHVRPARPSELKDLTWRLFNRSIDVVPVDRAAVSGQPYYWHAADT